MGLKAKLKGIKIKKKVVIIGVVLLVAVGMGVSSYAKAQKSKVKQVSLAKVTKKKVVQSVSATGNIEANYRTEIALNPSQKVVKVFVSEGQQVKKDDVLVQLDASDYENQLEKAKISLSTAQSTLNQIQSTGSASEESNAQNTVAQAKATLENAERNYQDLNKKYIQNQDLFSKGYLSKTDFDASKKAVEDAETAIKAAQSTLTSAQTALSNVSSTSSDKITAQKNQMATAQADITNLTKKIEDSKLKANTDGVVIKMDAKENQLPKSGDMIIVDDNSKFKVSVDMTQYDAIKVAVGQKVDIKVKGSDKKYTGQVAEIGKMAQEKADDTDKDYKVNIKINMDNFDDMIKAGYEADTEIIVSQKDNVIAVGFDGIKEEKSTGKKYVYVVDSKNKIQKKYIKAGVETDYDVEVIDGLKEGEQYVVNPPDTLHEGDLVADANKTGGSKK
ncbi:HlyD family efflux transporter periplasmic adaptor subunit [Clostridiaceae bacterium UIB06]|uniref:HlyD family efflux transporter periplasmic adaptor subunit n=1 Tax=Clostridium thailandense TaxID=2794346 RepID=A0A949WWM7_9CLOT|nr:HlyD family efflux transporter periplasmic adaptor subunit [Clostridium thailandense]MBV7275002.1 HlyD family efflux transporter periplasmic adaptor subunit [Clostridium thailandense]MCH5137921.1 HlyD family efflux transporter periplasmic adaptor subunit [Clostridiaceae bacterium UIB06]